MEDIILNKIKVPIKQNAFEALFRELIGKGAGLLSIIKLIEISALMMFSLIFIFPFLWMFATSFKTLQETMLFPPSLIPKQWIFQNYLDAWRIGGFHKYAFNSLFVTISVLLAQLIVIVPAAYTFAWKKFKGSQLLFGIILLGLMIPSQVTFLPIYLLFCKLGLINTPWALIIPFAASPFGIFLLTQNFKQIPRDIWDAARLEKAHELQIVFRIMLPLVKPAIITFALFSFIAHWNDYFWVLTMTNSDVIRTLPIGVVNLKDSESIKSWHIIMAGNVILVAPILFIYTIASRQIKSAFTYSGIK